MQAPPPADFETLLQEGLTRYRNGAYADALAAYEQAGQLLPSHRSHHGRGDCLLALGELQPAIEAYRDALALSPRYFRSHMNLAETLRRLNRTDEARFHLRQANLFKPDDPHIQRLLCALPFAPGWQDVPVSSGPIAAQSPRHRRRALLAYPAVHVTDSSQTTNVYQAWGLLLRRAFEAAGWQVDARRSSDFGGEVSPLSGSDRYDFALLLDYSGPNIARCVLGLRRQAEVVAYFNESADAAYTRPSNRPEQADVYFQASLCGPADFDHRSQWRQNDYLRIVPPFRTLAPDSSLPRTAVLVNGPMPPRYAVRFEAEMARSMRFAVDVNALLRRLRAGLPPQIELLQLLPDTLSRLALFEHDGEPRPFGCPDWRIDAIDGVTNIEPLPIAGLRPLLARCAHYVVTHQESFGGLVLDALSLGLTVHYPGSPLLRSHALAAMRTAEGFRVSRAPQLRAYASLDELQSQLDEGPAAPAELLEPAALAGQMMADCERVLARRSRP